MSDEKDEDYSGESFLDDEPGSSKIHSENIEENPIQFVDVEDEANKESFVSAVENFAEVSSPPGMDDNDDHEDASGVVVTCMSTIEEESKSCYESSTAPSMSHSHRRVVVEESRNPVGLKYAAGIEQQQDLNVSSELREFQQLVNETEAELSGNHPNITTNLSTYSSAGGEANLNENSLQKSSHNNVRTNVNVCDESQDLVNVFMKLEQLQNTQDTILEQVLNADFSVDANELNALISQIPLGDTRLRNLLMDGYDDHSERSVTSEIASIQKIIDGGGGSGLEIIDTSNSQKSEVAGGNNLLSPSDPLEPGVIGSTFRDRDVNDVLREYEELERSLSSASAIDESFRSDVSSLPPLATYSISKNPEEVPHGSVVPPSVPVIKPPVLKTVVPPPTATPPTKVSKEYQGINQALTMTSVNHPSAYASSYRTRPMASSSNKVTDLKPKSSRVETSQLSTANKPLPPPPSHSARSSNNAQSSSRNNTQDAYKPRNRRMRSPRTIVSPGQPATCAVPQVIEVQRNNMTGAGENYHSQEQEHVMTNAVPNPNPHPSHQQHQRHITERTDYAVAEALKTIQKLNTMVERQETLLEAYSKDNDKLWTQLKDAKAESLEKDSNFQDVINSLRTEVATLKLNRLVASSTPSKANSNTQTQGGILSPSPSVHNNKAETERLREDVDLKSQQLLELRKEVLLLQTKLSEVHSANNNPLKQSKAAVPKPPAAGGASALVFHEKEKEYQKEVTVLKKQVRTLQKILYSKEPTAPPVVHQQTTTGGNRTASKPLQRTRSDISRQNLNLNPHQQALIKNIRNTGVDVNAAFPRRPGSSPNKGVNINTSEIIQASFSCIDKEREEFEKIIEDKNKLILEKERTVLNLKNQVETLKGQIPEGDVVEPGLVDELRSRIITQNKAIQTLKEHLSTFKKLEAENLLLREDRNLLEHQVQELRRKLEFAQHLVKPENEVLCLLSEKVDELNSRYHHRERQLDTLLSKLTLKTTTGGGCGGGITSSSSNSSSSGLITTNLSPRRMPLDQFSNNNGSLGGLLTIGKARPSSSYISAADILHMGDFSPSNSFQLFNSVSDLPDM